MKWLSYKNLRPIKLISTTTCVVAFCAECDPNATCDTEKMTCECNNGFTGDGRTCIGQISSFIYSVMIKM